MAVCGEHGGALGQKPLALLIKLSRQQVDVLLFRGHLSMLQACPNGAQRASSVATMRGDIKQVRLTR